MKRTLSWIMVLLMVVSLFSAAVSNVSAETFGQDGTLSVPEQEEPVHEVVVAHSSGGNFTGEKWGYDELNIPLKEGRVLPDNLDWYRPERYGYRFDGWYAKPDGAAGDTKYNGGETVPEGVTDFYACWVRVVVLDAEPGNFTGDPNQNYTRTVDIVDGKFPGETETPVYNSGTEVQTVEFNGWYTEKTEVIKSQEDGGKYWTVSIQTNGDKIEAGEDVPEGITTLYAGYKMKEETSPRKTITYYYDWNGINGMWGHCLTSSRAYNDDMQGYKLTGNDLLIRYLNWDGDEIKDGTTQETLDAYWKGKTFNGYTFLGWATEPEAETPDFKVGDVIENGESIYAVWEKDGTSSKEFDRKGPAVGPLTAMRFLNLKSYTHGTKNSKLTIALYISPVEAELPEVTWTLSYGEERAVSPFAPYEMKTGTVTDSVPFEADGFKAAAKGRELTIENTDGQEHSITVSAKVTLADGTVIETPAEAVAVFGHNWSAQAEGHKDPTCTERGSNTYKCTECGATEEKAIPPLEHLWRFQITKEPNCTETGIMQMQCIRENCHTTFEEYQEWLNERGRSEKPAKAPEVIPALGHNYKVTSTDSIDENGMRCFTEECTSCRTEESGQYGDVNKDGEVSLVDAVQMYQFLNEQVDSLSQEVAGDIDGSNEVTEVDAEKLYEYVSGQTSSL